MPELLRTSLYDAHKKLGAKMVDFHGWEMPLHYPAGILAEHRAVRNACGLFDVSHMGRIALRGQGAAALLDLLFTGEIDDLPLGKARYGFLCNEKGGIIDDVVVLSLAPQAFLLVCNAASWDRALGWVQQWSPRFEPVEIVPGREETAMIALQGPAAAERLETLAPGLSTSLPPFAVTSEVVAGLLVTVARTGYTGEDGFEFILGAKEGPDLWRALLKEGAAPCGLGARDTLRLEAGFRLHGQDMDEDTTPLEAALGRFVRMEKVFVGVEALREQKRAGLSRRLVGFTLEGHDIPRAGYAVRAEGQEIGRVTSGTFSPTLQRGIGLAYAPPRHAEPGTRIIVDIRGRDAPGKVVALPFYRRKQGESSLASL